ncbi:hypothetical protein P171DRAFT_487107 [Karstenula rhodostoma CBS 690.94]|uniref:Zn(2)-C6 fungal-type domain-containing protein n=1 Tax=Karstenula rhodostoma CBS 690.94 TaxID=1392251 RepID=A0A9P4UBI1_9PLEO|nr:hypothetical protein P171DRAFT_487107 [Karstenula rhodostoma CBS 690.94]
MSAAEPPAAPAVHQHHHGPSLSGDLKRKRSPSHDHMHPAAAQKAAKTSSNHLQINYLARHCENDLPLLTNDDTLPNILSLLSDYQGVLDRHESMACNLGARPLGPILVKRFERLFDGPPRVLKSHGKDGTTVTWLDVVEFARNKPEQFQLGQMSEGIRVCQFYTKQCRVQISEEDFVLISSGIPQKMIPPQPIIEDEEKELGTLDILERNLGQICQLADQVAARTRQLNHRLKGRKQAILDRRATASPAPPIRPSSPSNVALMNGISQVPTNQTLANPSTQSSPGGFVAVNSRPHPENGASTSTRHELMSKFHTTTERRTPSQPSNGPVDARRPSMGSHTLSHSAPPPHQAPKPAKPADLPPSALAQQRPSHMSDSELHQVMNSPVPIPNTPSSLLPAASQRAQQPQDKDDGGPFKAEMVHRMESLAKGERILPPCDRCRRLHMDCLKNLTACMGCTKKHAKCSWREVRDNELRSGTYSHPPSAGMMSGMHSESDEGEISLGSVNGMHIERASTGSPAGMLSPQRGGLTPSHVGPSPAPHPPPEHRIPSSLNSPPPHERESSRGVEAQLQEAAKSGLAHASARLGAPPETSKPPEYQAMVA